MEEGIKFATKITKEAREMLDLIKNDGLKVNHFIDKAIKNEYKRLTKEKGK